MKDLTKFKVFRNTLVKFLDEAATDSMSDMIQDYDVADVEKAVDDAAKELSEAKKAKRKKMAEDCGCKKAMVPESDEDDEDSIFEEEGDDDTDLNDDILTEESDDEEKKDDEELNEESDDEEKKDDEDLNESLLRQMFT